MRSDFLMALLVCGTLVVALPPITDRMHSRDLVELLSRQSADAVYHLEGRMSTEYRFGCYVLGAGMIGTAVVASALGTRSRRRVEAVRDRRFSETDVMPPEHGT